MKNLLTWSLGTSDGHTVYQFTQWHFTANWVTQQESDSSYIGNKVSFDWLLCYIKAKQIVLETFKMVGEILDRVQGKGSLNEIFDELNTKPSYS